MAHPAPYSYLDLRLDASGLHGSLVIHDFDAAHELGLYRPDLLLNPEVATRYRDRLAGVAGLRLRIIADGRLLTPTWGELEVVPERQSLRLTVRFDRSAPAAIKIQAALFPYDPNHQTFINIYEGDRLRHQAILDAGHTTLDYYAGTVQGAWAVVRVFVPAGIHHILVGPDHILFLIGLLLLGGSLPRLVGIVTAFTVGHSITLSLASLDVVAPSASLVEPAIALSIIVVGVDNLLVGSAAGARGQSPSGGHRTARDLRPWVAAAFGLVHGFGFAAVLKQFGLPGAALGWSLFSFNVGVEIGQMAVVAVVASLLAFVRRHSITLGERLAIAGSVGVVAAGSYWFVQRVFLTGGAS